MLRQLHSAAAQEKSLMIDLSGAHYVSSAGLRSLMIVLKGRAFKKYRNGSPGSKANCGRTACDLKFDQVFKIIRSK